MVFFSISGNVAIVDK